MNDKTKKPKTVQKPRSLKNIEIVIKYYTTFMLLIVLIGHGSYFVALLPFMAVGLVAIVWLYTLVNYLVTDKLKRTKVIICCLLFMSILAVATGIAFKAYLSDITGPEPIKHPDFTFVDPTYMPAGYSLIGVEVSSTKDSISRSYIKSDGTSQRSILITERISKYGNPKEDCEQHWTNCRPQTSPTVYAHYFLGNPDFVYCVAGRYSVELDLVANTTISTEELSKICNSIN